MLMSQLTTSQNYRPSQKSRIQIAYEIIFSHNQPIYTPLTPFILLIHIILSTSHKMGSFRINFFLIFQIIFIVSISLNGANAARILPMEQWLKIQPLLLESLPRGPVPPSSGSSCTYIPGQGGPPCPLNEKHFVGDHLHRHVVRTLPASLGSDQSNQGERAPS